MGRNKFKVKRNKSPRSPQFQGQEGAGQTGKQGKKTFYLRHKHEFLTPLALGHLVTQAGGVVGDEGC